MPLHQLLYLLRVPHDAVRRPWVFSATVRQIMGGQRPATIWLAPL